MIQTIAHVVILSAVLSGCSAELKGGRDSAAADTQQTGEASPTAEQGMVPDAKVSDGGTLPDGQPDAAPLDAPTPDVPQPQPDTTVDAPPPDTTVDVPQPDTTADAPPPDTTADAPPPDTTADAPAPDTTADAPPPDTTVDAPPPDTTVDAPPPDTTVDAPPPDTTVDAPSPDSTVDATPPPILTTSHTGWFKKWCYTSGCHTSGGLPASHDASWSLAKCADCHGGNGSCDANGGPRVHTKQEDCASSGCHGSHHSYTVSADCAACHMASTGLVDCSP